jgi:hypothetical protein
VPAECFAILAFCRASRRLRARVLKDANNHSGTQGCARARVRCARDGYPFLTD